MWIYWFSEVSGTSSIKICAAAGKYRQKRKSSPKDQRENKSLIPSLVPQKWGANWWSARRGQPEGELDFAFTHTTLDLQRFVLKWNAKYVQ